MPPLIQFTKEEIEQLVFMEFQKRLPDLLQDLIYGIDLRSRYEMYMEQKKRVANTARSTSSSLIQLDQGTSDSLVNDYESGTNHQAIGIPVAMPVGTRIHRIEMHSTRDGYWYGLLATLDTGTTENWITKSIVDRLGLRVTNGLVTKWTTFNGQELTSGSSVTPTWCSEGHKVSHIANFRVVNNGPFDVLFGRNLLSSPEINGFQDENGGNPITALEGPPETPADKAQELINDAIRKAETEKLKKQRAEQKQKEKKNPVPSSQQAGSLQEGKK